MITFVLPKFTRIFEKAGVLLPAPTRILLGIAHFFSNYWYIPLAAAVALPMLIYVLLRVDAVRKAIDSLMLFLPFIGAYVSLSQSTVMLRTLGTPGDWLSAPGHTCSR